MFGSIRISVGKVAGVAAGGAVGSSARALLSLAIPSSGFPFHTLAVNLIGSLLLGWFLAARQRTTAGPGTTRFVAIGMLGSFTTFSAFGADVIRLSGGAAVLYLAASVLGGLTSALVGHRLGERR